MGRLEQVTTYLDDASRLWLGWTLPPAHRAWEEADWRPDEPGTYCPRCGEGVGAGEATVTGCAVCREWSWPFDATVRLGRYEDVLRDWVLGIKFHAWVDMGYLLGRELAIAVRRAGVVDRQRVVVVPMPMPWLRRMHRGIDHASVIAAGVARELEAPVARILTKRIGPAQVSLSRSERRRNAARAMGVRRRWGGWPVEGLDLLIVDDVRTTGASLRAAGRLLRPLKPDRVVGAVLSVADATTRRGGRADAEIIDPDVDEL